MHSEGYAIKLTISGNSGLLLQSSGTVLSWRHSSSPRLFKTKWVGNPSLHAIWSPQRQQEKLHPLNMLNLTLILDPSPISQETTLHRRLQALLQCISPSSLPLCMTCLEIYMQPFSLIQWVSLELGNSLEWEAWIAILLQWLFNLQFLNSPWRRDYSLYLTLQLLAAHHWIVYTAR